MTDRDFIANLLTPEFSAALKQATFEIVARESDNNAHLQRNSEEPTAASTSTKQA